MTGKVKGVSVSVMCKLKTFMVPFEVNNHGGLRIKSMTTIKRYKIKVMHKGFYNIYRINLRIEYTEIYSINEKCFVDYHLYLFVSNWDSGCHMDARTSTHSRTIHTTIFYSNHSDLFLLGLTLHNYQVMKLV